MPIFLEIVRFELRQQLRSPFLLAALLLFFLVHLLAVTSTGVTLWAHPQANINSTYAVAVAETTLSAFGMLAVIVFVANAILRDQDTATVELFFVKPISGHQYYWGRFAAACLLAILLGLAGVLGSAAGTMMPWLDQERIAPFSLRPFLFGFLAIVVPNMVVLSGLFFSVAALTRSLASTVALALVLFTGDLLLANAVLNGAEPSRFSALADYAGSLAIDAASRNLTVTELNLLTPGAPLLSNRLVWLVLAFAVLAFGAARFRLALVESPARRWRRRSPAAPRIPLGVPPSRLDDADHRVASRAGATARAAQLGSQLRMDLSSVLRSPLFVLVLILGAVSTVSDYQATVAPVMNSPVHPVTSALVDAFRFGTLPFVLIIAIYYSGLVVHREREAAIDQIVGASPMPDWILPLSKTLALGAIVTLLLVVKVVTSIALQAANGYRDFELGLYLRAGFLHNGVYYWMLAVLAVLIQIVVANKWVGMLVVLAINVLLFSLGALGFEHVLYGYSIPHVVYSDLNGFGHLSRQVDALILYWGCFCGLLVVVGHLYYPRGAVASFSDRVRAAVARLNPPVAALMALFLLGFVVVGTWIFYNTNVLNHYRTSGDLERVRAEYERKYRRYEDRPSPSLTDIDLAVDLFPRERRLDSHGTATLTNSKSVPIAEFVISVDPRMTVDEVVVTAATLTAADTAQGFYLFTLASPMAPGATATLRWRMSRINRGFANAHHDTEVVENGTFVGSEAVMPMPGFDHTRAITDPSVRRKHGLEPSHGLPALGDRRYLDRLAHGVDGRSRVRVVMSTAEDQIAVASGKLERSWLKDGRRYFEYLSERPVWPRAPLMSARYEVATDRWTDGKRSVALEVYHHPRHRFNVDPILATTKRSLDYLTREFGPYPYSVFRIVEYPRYRLAAKAYSGAVAYSEGTGWLTDLATLHGIDYTTIHELSHMWWGDHAYGAKMQGQAMLNETLAQYSTLMVYRKYDRDENTGPGLANRIAMDLQGAYLASRSQDTGDERPVMYTDNQDYVSYGKGALALYALQDLIGEAAVNRALRNYLTRFAFKAPPFPTSRDLVNELRAVAGPDHQGLITDLFEKIVLYELRLTGASAAKVGDGYEVTLTVAARQLEVAGHGAEVEAPLRAWFDIGLFADAGQAGDDQKPLYLAKHLLEGGLNTITIPVAAKPAWASVDPFRRMADRWPGDNGRAVEMR